MVVSTLLDICAKYESVEKIDELFDKIQTLIPYDFDAIHDV